MRLPHDIINVFLLIFSHTKILNVSPSLLLLQFVIASLTGWTLLFYGGYKFFTGGKKEEVRKITL